MSAIDVQERKLRDLVEQAGFELAVDLDRPRSFRITTKDLQPVAAAEVVSHGFKAVFPARGVVAKDPTSLVDVLEAIKREGGEQ